MAKIIKFKNVRNMKPTGKLLNNNIYFLNYLYLKIRLSVELKVKKLHNFIK